MANGELCAMLNDGSGERQWVQPEGSAHPVPFGSLTGMDIVNAGGKPFSAPRGIYNLTGQKVGKAGRGIYIVNGRKMLFR